MTNQATQRLTADQVLELLRVGSMEIRGLLPGSSNYTFLADVTHGAYRGLAVYKPVQGETPLWDFPHGTLSNRELAAYLVSEALGWHLVPPTVVRVGPYGKGAVQWFVDADFRQHYFTFRDDPAHYLTVRKIAAFDLVVNNADRKSGHCLLDREGRVWAIDHGICFHVQPKLRTVIWDCAGEPLPEEVTAGLHRLREALAPDCELARSLEPLLSAGELRALVRRVEALLDCGVYPAPDPHRRCYPWPLV